jgi:hypothetical protein
MFEAGPDAPWIEVYQAALNAAPEVP